MSTRRPPARKIDIRLKAGFNGPVLLEPPAVRLHRNYHYLFPQLTMGLALLIFLMKSLGWNDAARVATGWWALGFPIAVAYFVTLFRLNRGKIIAAREGEGY